MNGDYVSPFVETSDEMIKSYENTLRNVKLSLPVMYKNIVKIVCDLASNELGSGKLENI